MFQWNSWLQGSYRQARRVAISVVGFTVLAFGLVLLVTPGPAFVVIPIGLGILAIEFAWARRWLLKIKEKAQDAADRWNGKSKLPEESDNADSPPNVPVDASQAKTNPQTESIPSQTAPTPSQTVPNPTANGTELHTAEQNSDRLET